MEKICWQITVAAFMQPLQYDLRSPAAKDNSITHTATAWSNLDAAITMRSAETELQNTIELRATASEIVASKPDLDARAKKKTILKHFFKRIFRRKITSAKMEKICWQIIVAAFMQPLQYDLRSPAAKDNSITHTAKAGSNLDAAITMWVAKHNRTTRNGVGNCSFKTGSRRQSEKKKILKHFLKGFLEGKSLAPKWRKNAFRARLPSKLHRQLIHQHHLQSHLHCGNDPTVANHNGILSTAHARKTLETPFTMRNRSENDPTMIRPHTRPSRTRRTAEVDHRRSETDFVWKNTGFRASAISQKRISCETSFKTPSATHPPAPLAIPFTLRERSYSCKSQWNSVDRTCTKNTWNPIYNAEPIREWSDHDPTTHETVSHPSHRRGRSSTFGDGLCMEKHRVSCICYLSKTHFVRDFLQNSIGNSSTSTTCNPIYIAWTILQLQITMEFCRPHMHEKHLKPHLQCGTDPRMIRPWSDHTRDRLAPVAPQR